MDGHFDDDQRLAASLQRVLAQYHLLSRHFRRIPQATTTLGPVRHRQRDTGRAEPIQAHAQ